MRFFSRLVFFFTLSLDDWVSPSADLAFGLSRAGSGFRARQNNIILVFLGGMPNKSASGC